MRLFVYCRLLSAVDEHSCTLVCSVLFLFNSLRSTSYVGE